MTACHEWMKLTSQNSLYAISRLKYALRQGISESIEDGLMFERDEFGNIFQTPEMIEGTNAFLEKRKANFKGQ